MNLRLFWIFLKIGMFTIGGGPAMIPIVQNEVVEQKKLINEQDFLDSVAFASGLPGAIIVNLSVFVGDKINGTLGAISSAIGAILPAYIAIVVLASVFDKISSSKIIQSFFLGIRPTVIILIGLALYSIIQKTKYDKISIVFGAVSLLLLAYFKLSAFTVFVIAGILGLIVYSRFKYAD